MNIQFRHSEKSPEPTSEFAPIIQQMTLENSNLTTRLAQAELRISELERELSLLKMLHSPTQGTTKSVAPMISRKQSPPSKPTTISHSASLVKSHLDASTPQKYKPPSRGQAKFDRPKKQRAKNSKESTPELCNDFSFSLQHESVVDSRFLSTNPWKALEVTEEEPQLLPPKCLKLNLRPPLEPLECVEIPTPPSQSPSPIPLTSTPSSKPTPSPLDSPEVLFIKQEVLTVVPTLLWVAEPKAAARRSPRKQFPIITCKLNKQWKRSIFRSNYTIHIKRL
jgi:hypothetical protein